MNGTNNKHRHHALARTFNRSRMAAWLGILALIFGMTGPGLAQMDAGIAAAGRISALSGVANQLKLHYNRVNATGFPVIVSYVVVQNDSGYNIGDLNENHFVVHEDGVRELPIKVEELTDSIGVTVVLVIDRSTSMRGQPIVDARNAAVTFVQLMNKNDEAAVVSFASKVRTDYTFTNNKDSLIAAIQGINAKGGTAIFDALIHSAKLIETRQGQRAIILLTDGHDKDSNSTLQEALNAVRPTGVPVFTIGLNLGRGSQEERVLQDIAAATGGRYYRSPSSGDLNDIYKAISALLHHVYRITYTTHNPARDGTLRHVRITVNALGSTSSDTASYRAPLDLVTFALASSDVPVPGRTFTVQLRIPDSSVPVYELRRMTFRLKFDARYLRVPNPLAQSVRVSNLFGSAGEHRVQVSVDQQRGNIDITVEKTTGGLINGFGKLMQFTFQADTSLPDRFPLVFSLQNFQAFNRDNVAIPTETVPLTLRAYGYVTFALNSGDVLRPGKPFRLQLEIPPDTKSLPGLQHLSFIIKFDPTYLKVADPQNQALRGGVLFGSNSEFQLDYSVDANQGLINMTLSRKAGFTMVAGRGALAEMRFDVRWDMPDSTEAAFEIVNLLATDSLGWNLPVQLRHYRDWSNGMTVWPGDTNHNGAVELSDVNMLGIYWSIQGPGRPDEPDPLAWKPQYSARYPKKWAAHADADGSGRIDERDLIPIGLNWGKNVQAGFYKQNGKSLWNEPPTPQGRIAAYLKRFDDSREYRIVLEYQTGESQDLMGITLRLRYPERTRVVSVEPGELWASQPLMLVQDIPQEQLLAIGLMQPATSTKAMSGAVLMSIAVDLPEAALKDLLTFDYIALVNAAGQAVEVPVSEAWRDGSATAVQTFQVLPAYPNPFNPSTRVRFALPQAGEIWVRIFNLRGQAIRSDRWQQPMPGFYEYRWNGQDQHGQPVGSGVYFAHIYVKLRDGQTYRAKQKWTLLK
ncbi:MAG: VWA domain-containing protein [candidate division KSB1 bacterium]|nr:VWA domain-containing protein [candidate division KSB1 bacterium]